MGNEFFYIDENGKKQDAWIHEELLDEGNADLDLQQTEFLIQEAREDGDLPGLRRALARYQEKLKRYGRAK